MAASRTKNASRNLLWGLINKIIALGVPFATRTVMIYTMGMQYVGLSSLFTSVLQVLSFTELGIGSALVFSMYKPIAEGDDYKVCALLNFYRKAYRVIGAVILALGLVMLLFIDHLIAGEVPADINIRILFSIYILNTVIGYFSFAYKQSIFTASQRVDMISKITLTIQIMSGLAQILLLVLVRNYYAFIIVAPIATFISNMVTGIVTDKKFPQYKCRGKLENTELGIIKKKVGGMVFQKIGGIVLESVDTIVISAFLGLIVLAAYQNYYYIIKAIFGFLVIVMQSIISVVGNSIAVESPEKNYNDFKKLNFIYVWFVSWCTVALVCMYQPFMKIWVGEENMFGMSMVILFAIYFFTNRWCDMLYVYQEAAGIWWETKFVPMLAASTNLVVNIILVQIIGLPGVLISTIVCVVFIYGFGYAKVLFRTYFKHVNHGLIKYVGKQCFFILVVIGAAAITYFVCYFIPIESTILRFFVNLGICVVVPNLIFIAAWFKLGEFKGALKLAKQVFGLNKQ